MVTSNTLYLSLLLTVSSVSAQTLSEPLGSGIYITKDDYLNDRITDYSPSSEKNYIIEKFNKDVVVVRNGFAKRYTFGSLYGYTANGTKFRSHGSKSKAVFELWILQGD